MKKSGSMKKLLLFLLWLKYLRNEVKNLYFPSRFDILMEISLSMLLIWEMLVYRNNLTLPPATIVRH